MVALCGLCAAVAVWDARSTIGTAIVDRKLEAAHVRARYRIVDLGFGGQRLVDVAIGDPARPDLTADWIELRTRIGLDGAAVTAVRAGGLRVRASLANGRLSLGEVDRLLPKSTGGSAFRLPAIDVDVVDARAQVASALGMVDLSLSGRGRLDDGFRGRATATSGRLAAAGCVARRPALTSMIRTDRGAVTLTGATRAGRLACTGGVAELPVADLTVELGQGLADWRGGATLRADRVATPAFAARDLRGRIGFAGSARTTTGDIALTGGPARIASVTSHSLMATGRYRLGADPSFAGQVRAVSVSAPSAMLEAIRRRRHAAAATPIAPLVDDAAAALARAVRDVDGAARVAFDGDVVSLTRLDAVARSGARASFLAAGPVRLANGRIPAIAGTARVWGGGLPSAAARIAGRAPSEPIRGVAVIAPYAAGEARLALDPVRFEWGRGGARIRAVATLSGPLRDGRVDGLRLPVTADWNDSGRLTINPGCSEVSFDRLALATLRLRAARVPLCATGRGLIQVDGGKVAGGARIAAVRLVGTLGSSPVTLAAGDTRITLADRGMEAHHVAARLGAGDAATRLDVARLAGAVTDGGLGGRLDGAAGRIGKIPLLLSDGAGEWRVEHGALTLAATATIADATATARFKPMRADAIRLRVAGGAIGAAAALVTPDHAIRVADVTIAHDLARGVGDATLAVPGLAFTDAFQPDALTPLIFGVIADVRGTVTGDARIGWGPAGVTSTGTFRTDGLDLAAAFGPVRGLAGTIRFTDLLQLESAPGQVATVASINPGVPVEDGRVVYRLLPDARIAVAGGHWPFAGGSLDLRPTTLAFGAPSERRLTFALDGVDAGRFLQQFNFGNLSATGTFDGTLPMIFDADGGTVAKEL